MSTNHGFVSRGCFISTQINEWIKAWSSIWLYQNYQNVFSVYSVFQVHLLMPTASDQQAECLLSPDRQHTVSEQLESDVFNDISHYTIISLVNVHRIHMHSILLRPQFQLTTIMQSERENYVETISKEHKGKIIRGLRKESEPNPASVHGDPAWLMWGGGIRFWKWASLIPYDLA